MLNYIILYKIKTFPIENFHIIKINSLKKELIKEILSSIKKYEKYKFAVSYRLIFKQEDSLYPIYLSGLLDRLNLGFGLPQVIKYDEYGKEESYYEKYYKLDTFKEKFLNLQSLLDLQFILKIISQTNEKSC